MYCTTELYLSVDKRKKTTNKGGTMLVYNVYAMCVLSHVKTERTYTLLNCRRLLKAVSCHHLPAVIVRSIRIYCSVQDEDRQELQLLFDFQSLCCSQ